MPAVSIQRPGIPAMAAAAAGMVFPSIIRMPGLYGAGTI
jgi:hypothetical protein